VTRASALARSALAGLLVGVLASVVRAPIGTEWSRPDGPDPATAVALALIAATAFAFAGSRVVEAFGDPSARLAWLGGTVAGVSVHGLVLVAWIAAPTLAGALATGAAVAAASVVLAPKAPASQLPIAPRLGPFLIALAAGESLASTRAPLRALGGGESGDDALFLAVFAALAALGACAAAAVAARRAPSPVVPAVASLLAVVAAYEGRSWLAPIGERDELASFLGSPPWSLSLDDLGRWPADTVLAARALVVPAFALGTALACSRRRGDAAALVTGVAYGSIGLFLAGRPAVTLVLAAAGTALACWHAASASRAARGLGWALAVAALALAVQIDAPPQRPADEVTVRAGPAGEPVLLAGARRWTAFADERDAEASMLSRAAPAEGVLLVGPSTPSRRAAAVELGFAWVDRTAPFWERLDDVEAALGGGDPFPGEVLDPSMADEHLGSGHYDALVVPPVFGVVRGARVASWLTAPNLSCWIWLDGAGDAATREWSPRVELAFDGLERMFVGITDRGEVDGGAPLARELPLARLRTRLADRARHDLERTARRLALAARGGPRQRFFEALALHFAAQAESSPFETRAEQVELDERALELWREDALAREPDRVARELWANLARLLAGKRDLERIERHVAPVAERWAFWPELEEVLAAADLEMLDPASAAERLARVAVARPQDAELRRRLGWALLAAGDARAAVAELERTLELEGDDPQLRRELAIARVRAGDPQGRSELEALLRADPDDRELRAHAGPGPYPPLSGAAPPRERR
jgi:hypothetical protein